MVRSGVREDYEKKEQCNARKTKGFVVEIERNNKVAGRGSSLRFSCSIILIEASWVFEVQALRERLNYLQ